MQSQESTPALLEWLATADFPPPPLRSLPGIEHWDTGLMRDILLSGVPNGSPGALLKLRALAARYGTPDIQALVGPPPEGPRTPQL